MGRRLIAALLLMMAFSGPAPADVEKPIADVRHVTVRLPRESRFVAVSDGEIPVAWLQVCNPGNEMRTARLELCLVSPDGRETVHDLELELSLGGEERAILLRERLGLNGIYRVRFRLTVDGETSDWQQDVLARYHKNAPARKGQSVFPIGFASSAPRPTPWLFDIAASVGSEFHRFETRWPQRPQSQGPWNALYGQGGRYIGLTENGGLPPTG